MATVEELSQRVDTLTNTVNDLQAKIAVVLKQKDDAIKEKDAAIAAKDALIAQLQAEVAAGAIPQDVMDRLQAAIDDAASTDLDTSDDVPPPA